MIVNFSILLRDRLEKAGALKMRMLHRVSPYVRLVHDFVTARGLKLFRRKINDHALLYFQSGTGHFVIENQTTRIEPHTLYLIRPGTTHQFQGDDQVGFHMLNIHMDLVEREDSEHTTYHLDAEKALRRRRLEKLAVEGECGLPERIPIKRPEIYKRCFDQMGQHFQLTDPISRLRLKAGMLELLGFIYEEHRCQSTDTTHGFNLPALQRALSYVQENFDRPITLSNLAEHARISRSYLSLRFKERYGVAPKRYLTEIRMEKAKAALAFGQTPIKEVARQTGFQSIHHFTNVFRKETGQTPAAYRRGLGRDG